MGWLAVFGAFFVVGALGIVINVNRLRFERRVAKEVRELVARSAIVRASPQTTELPAPVARYRQLAVGGRAPVHTLHLHHGGTFRLSPSAKDLPIDGAQVFTADPPGFVWTGRIRMAPGLWVDARDMYIGGAGSMRVLLDDTVRLADAHGPELDQGSALRALAEMVWYPTALFDDRLVTWTGIDATHARATLGYADRQVSGVFEFGSDGLPRGIRAERFKDKAGLQPWGGTYGDWRTVSGLRVPFAADVSWQLASGTYTYAHWLIESMEYDRAPSS